MMLLLFVLLLISAMAGVMVTGVASGASKNLARFYSIEAVDKFNSHISQDLALVRKVAHSKAVTSWFADEENKEKRTAAWQEMMDYVGVLQNAELYFGINDSLNEFAINSKSSFDDFVPGSTLDPEDPVNVWYYQCIISENEYVLDIDIDKFSHQWNLWIDHKVIFDGKLAGVFSSGLNIDAILNDMFSQYDTKNVRGYVIDRYGKVQMDSSNYELHREGNNYNIHDIVSDPVFSLEMDSYLENISGYFKPRETTNVIKLSRGPYGYVSITPISYSDWSVVTFFNNRSLFSVTNFLPLIAAILAVFVLYTLAGNILMRRLVLLPLNKLTKSLADVKSSAGNLYGHDRGDEIGKLSRTIEDMRDTLKSSNTMMETVNKVAAILLQSDIDEFADNLRRSMGLVAQAANTDRVRVWKNHVKDGRLYCTQISEWVEGVESMQGTKITIDTSYDDSLPGWEEKLMSGFCINNMVRNLSAKEQTRFSSQGIKSILITPVFLRENLWGFVGLNDCRNERIFSENEETMARSSSLLITSALLRNEMTLNIRSALEKAEDASRAKGNFLSNMSHEIRTPMNAIIGMTSIGRNSPDINKKDYAFEKIEGASTHLLSIINDILDMSKIEAGKFELSPVEFSFDKLLQKVDTVISFRIEEKKQILTMNLDRNIPPFLIGDDIRLIQVIINLLTNAVKFTPEEKSIHLEAFFVKEENNEITLKFSVKDTGIGISQEQQKRLFNSFEQAENSTSRKFGGTGLGLAISKHIVELMGGKIWIESELGAGATFIFTIQVLRGEGKSENLSGETSNKISLKQGESYSGCHLLLAEDVDINREIVLTMLEPLKLEIDCAVNGNDAVRLFTDNPGRYDVIFMDMQMPEMDGLEATRHIRAIEAEQKKKKTPIIAMTANVFREDVEKCLAAGMNDHIGKPLIFGEVMEKLRYFIPPKTRKTE